MEIAAGISTTPAMPRYFTIRETARTCSSMAPMETQNW